MAADFIAGTVGGAAGVLVGHPFDTVKVRLQTQSVSRPKYRGSLHCFTTIIRQESVFGLFKGMASPIVGLTFVNTLVFGVQGNIMRQYEHPTLFSHFLAGGVAGGLQSFISGPLELGKIRMQVQRKHSPNTKVLYTGSLDALRKIHKMEGIRGCYRGLLLTILRDTPGFAVYFMTFELYSSQIAYLYSDLQIGVLGLLAAGGFSGMTSWLISYSFDVMKTRVQADGVSGKNEYEGIVDVFRKSLRNEGFRALNRGLGTTLLRAFPVNAATFTGAALTLELMGQTNNNSYNNNNGQHNS